MIKSLPLLSAPSFQLLGLLLLFDLLPAVSLQSKTLACVISLQGESHQGAISNVWILGVGTLKASQRFYFVAVRLFCYMSQKPPSSPYMMCLHKSSIQVCSYSRSAYEQRGLNSQSWALSLSCLLRCHS